MAQLGFRTVNEMIGRVDRLDTQQAIDHWKAEGSISRKLLYRPDVPASIVASIAARSRITVSSGRWTTN